jgi:chitin-binding protein
MTLRHRIAALATAVTVPLLVTGLAPVPAAAHGAPAQPPSRSAFCGPEGGAQARSAACRAAVAAGADVSQWDNIRLPGVDGRDRQAVPDGRLCSGGIARFAGLDLARTDWPTTRLEAGSTFTFGYRATIPHKGRFRLYVTRPGYDPGRPLTWADLEDTPFLSVTDPPLRDGSYRIRGRLPERNGRHIIYTIWQTTSTPDTYYSCSDVVFTPGEPAGAAPAATTVPPSARSSSRPTGGAVAAAPTLSPTGVTLTAPVSSSTRTGALVWAGVAIVALLALAGVTLGWLRRRPARAGHRR